MASQRYNRCGTQDAIRALATTHAPHRNRQMTAAYGGGYNQQILSGHDQMHALMNSWRPRLISDDFFGDGRSKKFGIYVIVPEGYQ
jgi:hypothetical protein